MIAVLAGGVGAARFLAGAQRAFPPGELAAIVNTADDTVMHGLAISPDLDTVTYTLAGAIDPARGWGLDGETWAAMGALARYTPHRPDGSTAGGTWFNLGDRDLATHLYRTARLAEGAPLSRATAEIAAAWGVGVRILPMTDDPVRTMVRTPEGELGFQEYFVGRHHDVDVDAVRLAGIDAARPAPGVLDVIGDARVVVVAPSNPVVSIGPVVAVPGVRDALSARREHVVAVSPIVGGRALKGPADRMLAGLGHDVSVVGVARLYAPFASTLVMDVQDAPLAPEVARCGMRPVVTDTVMRDPEVAAALARTTIGAV